MNFIVILVFVFFHVLVFFQLKRLRHSLSALLVRFQEMGKNVGHMERSIDHMGDDLSRIDEMASKLTAKKDPYRDPGENDDDGNKKSPKPELMFREGDDVRVKILSSRYLYQSKIVRFDINEDGDPSVVLQLNVDRAKEFPLSSVELTPLNSLVERALQHIEQPLSSVEQR